jgi:hypothetical protein
MSNLRNPRPLFNGNTLPLFQWADTHGRRVHVSYPTRWLRRRFPDLSASRAALIAEQCGLGGRRE